MACICFPTSLGCGSDEKASGAGNPAEGPWVDAHTEEVQFPGPDFDLVGTLDVPAGRSGGRFPAVILIHGSGPVDRSENLSGQLAMTFGCTFPVFGELATHLRDAGYVTLRFDKRSCGTFNGCSTNDYPLPSADLTIDDFIDDVRAALEWLGARPEVDERQLVAIGHSEGAGYVPTLAEDGRIAGGILLAAPHSPFDAIIAEQVAFVRNLLVESGASETEIDASLRELDQLVADLAALRAGTFEGSQISGTGVEFWRSLFSLGDRTPGIVHEATRPLSFVFGDYDWNVGPSQAAAWESELSSISTEPKPTLTKLPCITHALNCVSEPDYQRVTANDIECSVHSSVLDTVRSSLRDVLTR
jgi:dienelactone hydrolase